jgi:predicted secreted hydrolase
MYAGAIVLAACGPAAGRTALTSDAPLVVKPAPTPAPPSLAPIRLPQDEAPHDVLAEWWYYTGHLFPDGQPADEYGFELVFFRGVRGDRPPGYAAHFAVTDVPRRRFRFDQRQDAALAEAARPATRPSADPTASAQHRPPGVVSFGPPAGGFDLLIGDWSMRGQNGFDHVSAATSGYALDLALAAVKPPTLHLGEPPAQPGVIPFGPGSYSYYYSRTRLTAAGTLAIDGREPIPVQGLAWMDHQWGDFLAVGWGGWDWFGGQLADGRDVAIFVGRDRSNAAVLRYGTLVEPDGTARHLPTGSFELAATGTWTSPQTGIRSPSGWRLRLPEHRLDVIWTPLLPEQEFDAHASTGNVYWEGAVAIMDAPSGARVGQGYVELTGYDSRK